MSGIDQINEGGDYIIENGVRRKVGYTTDELTENPGLLAVPEAALAAQGPALPPVIDSTANAAADTATTTTTAEADTASVATADPSTKKGR